MILVGDLQESYIRDIISVGRENPYPLTIVPKLADQTTSFIAIIENRPDVMLPTNSNFEIPEENKVSDRVRRLLTWANDRYLISFPTRIQPMKTT